MPAAAASEGRRLVDGVGLAGFGIPLNGLGNRSALSSRADRIALARAGSEAFLANPTPFLSGDTPPAGAVGCVPLGIVRQVPVRLSDERGGVLGLGLILANFGQCDAMIEGGDLLDATAHQQIGAAGFQGLTPGLSGITANDDLGSGARQRGCLLHEIATAAADAVERRGCSRWGGRSCRPPSSPRPKSGGGTSRSRAVIGTETNTMTGEVHADALPDELGGGLAARGRGRSRHSVEAGHFVVELQSSSGRRR